MADLLSKEDVKKINEFKCSDPSVMFILKTLISAIIGLVTGQCSIEEFKAIFKSLPIPENQLGVTKCCKKLNMSRTKFYDEITAGRIKKGIKKEGQLPYWDREYIEGLIKKG